MRAIGFIGCAIGASCAMDYFHGSQFHAWAFDTYHVARMATFILSAAAGVILARPAS